MSTSSSFSRRTLARLGLLKRRSSARRRGLALEALEGRQLLSIGVGTFDDTVDPDDGLISLREAIVQAAANPGADTIILPHAIEGFEGTYSLLLGELSIDDVDPLAIESDGGPATIDAVGASRVLSVAAGSVVTLEGLVITGGHADVGGGLLNNGSVTANNSRFTLNSADVGGGAIFTSGLSSTIITNGSVTDNTAGDFGGGISNAGHLEMTNSTLSGNSALGSNGGGLDSIGDVILTGTLFQGNHAAGYGGGLANHGIFGAHGTMVVIGGQFLGNTAGTNGGAIDSNGGLDLTDSLLDGNQANANGGAIGNGGDLTLDGCTISNNSALLTGGGIFNTGSDDTFHSTMVITDTTIEHNAALGGYGGGLSTFGMTTISGSTIRDNTAAYGGGAIDNFVGTLVISGTSILDNSTQGYGGGIHSYTATLQVSDSTISGNVSANSGGGVYIYGGTATLTDSTLNANTATYSGGGLFNDYTGILEVVGSIVSDNIAQYGGGGGLYNNYGGTANISGSQISGNSSSFSAGGGIYNYYGTTTVTGSTIGSNSANYDGGGLVNYYGQLNVSGSTIENNVAINGGGGGFANYGTTSISNAEFLGNFALYSGGGLYNTSSASISASTFSGNSAGYGGGITSNSFSFTLVDSLIYWNDNGGVGLLGNYYAQIQRNTISDNNGDGVRIDGGQSNTIGTPGDGNTITGNTGTGVYVTGSGTGNSIRGNIINSNGLLAIDLGNDGRTPNDPGDADFGPNGFQNFPVVTGFSTGATTRVTGRLNGSPNTTFIIDLYSDVIAAPIKLAESTRYLGSLYVTTDATGNAEFDVTLDAATATDEIVTATATDPYGNTSEFSELDLVRITPGSGLFTTESGASAGFSVVLTMQPSGNVTVPIASSNVAEGTVSVSSLTFTPENWNVPQLVTITGVDDAVADGPILYSILTGPTTSDDPRFDGADPVDVLVTNLDNDLPAMKAIAPLGSLIHDTALQGRIVAGGGIESYSLAIDPGQTITIIVDPESSDLTPTVQLFRLDSGGPVLIGASTASGAGLDALLQTLPTQGILGGAGTKNYRIVVSGSSNTTGPYKIRVILNAAVESEAHDGASNDTPATAQDLNGSMVLLNGAGAAGTQPSRAAVVGSIRGGTASTPQSFENFDNNYGNGFPFVLAPFGVTTMRYQQIYDRSQFDSSGLLQHLLFRRPTFVSQFDNLQDDVTIRVGYAARGTGNASSLFSDNLGSGLVTVYDGALTFDSHALGQPNPFDIDIDIADLFNYDPALGDLIIDVDVHSSAFPFPLYFSSTTPGVQAPTTRIYSYPDSSDFGYVDSYYGLVTQFVFKSDTDYYSLDLKAGQSATVALSNLAQDAHAGQEIPRLTLRDPGGNPVALGSQGLSTNVDSLIANFVATTAGRYTIEISGDDDYQYSLVVTRNADFGAGGNDTIATASDLTPTSVGGKQWVLGHVRGLDAPRLFATVLGSNSIVELDPLTGAQLNLFAAPASIGGPEGLAYDGHSLFLVQSNGSGTNTLWELDPDTGQVRDVDAILASGFVDGVAALNGSIYLSNSSTDQIYQFDPISDTIIKTLNLGIDLGGGLAGITNPNALIATVSFGIGVVEIDPSTGTITHGFSGPGYGIYGVAVLNGEIYLGQGFDAAGGLSVYSRDGTFLRQASLPYYVTALGGDDIGGLAQSHFYRVTLKPGGTVVIETGSPADQSGEFHNSLDAVIRLYDPAGNLVASNDNGAPDGRNALLSYKVPTGRGGLYSIEVTTADGGDGGEYVLSVTGATGAAPAFRVDATDPASRSTLTTPPTQVSVTFNDGVLLPTIQPSDLQIDGVAASGVTMTDGDTAVFNSPFVFQWRAEDGGNNHFYVLTTAATGWVNAEAEAVALGGHLVTVNDQLEQNFLKRAFFSGAHKLDPFWIGLNDVAVEGNFVWADGEPVTYTNWIPGQPDDYNGSEDGTVINWFSSLNNGGWNDLNQDNARFGIIELTSAPAGRWLATDGRHTITIAQGAIRDAQNTAIQKFSSTFTIDTIAPRIVSSSIQENDVQTTGDLAISITFSEPMNVANFSPTAFTLVGQFTGNAFPTSYSFDASGKILTVQYSGLGEDAFTLTLTSDARLSDLNGLELDGEPPSGPLPPNVSGDGAEGGDFFVHFSTDEAIHILPTPLVPAGPVGSLIYQTPAPGFGAIAAAGDTDDFTIEVAPGQTLTLIVSAGAGALMPTVEVIGPGNNLLGTASAAFVGGTAILQTVPTAVNGVYTIRVGGSAGSIGQYVVTLVLNAAVEEESHGGPTNNDIASAQPIDGSAIAVGEGGDRLAVLGRSGDADVYSLHLLAGQTVSAAFDVVNPSASLFGARTDYFGISPQSLALGDLNGDGKLDQVQSNSNNYNFSVRLNQGDGTFGPETIFGFASNPREIALADIDDDGNLDLIAATFYDGVIVMRGLGDGTFGAPVSYAAGYYNNGVTVGDFNDDGFPDIATTNEYDGTVTVLINAGDGTFAAPIAYFVGSYAWDVAAGDLDGDGDLDLAVILNTYSSTLAILRNNGDGTFLFAASYEAGAYATSVVIGDLDGNGSPDVAVSVYYENTVSVLLNNGDGTLGIRNSYYAGINYLSDVELGDLDGDGDLDLAVTAYYNSAFTSGGFSTLLNNGDGTFGSGLESDTAYYSVASVALGDLNGDGRLDAVTANYASGGISVYLGQSQELLLEILDSDGNVLAVGDPLSSMESFLADFHVPSTGTYYVLVSAPGLPSDYSLVITRANTFAPRGIVNFNPLWKPAGMGGPTFIQTPGGRNFFTTAFGPGSKSTTMTGPTSGGQGQFVNLRGPSLRGFKAPSNSPTDNTYAVMIGTPDLIAPPTRGESDLSVPVATARSLRKSRRS